MQKILVTLLILLFSTSVYAYFEDYPPHKFKDGPYKYLDEKPLSGEYISEDGKVKAIIKKTEGSLSALLQDGDVVLLDTSIPREDYQPSSVPYSIYHVDLDKNGFKDFLLFYSYMGNTLYANYGKVVLHLKTSPNEYKTISYMTFSIDIDDILDLDNDGKYEFMITGIANGKYKGKSHNYFTYNIYEIKDYKLVNANAKYKDFPKFVWYTDNPNDKDTVHLSEAERAKHIREINNLIVQGDVK